jgi:hypothetical protein
MQPLIYIIHYCIPFVNNIFEKFGALHITGLCALRGSVWPGHSASLHSHFLIAAQAVPIQLEGLGPQAGTKPDCRFRKGRLPPLKSGKGVIHKKGLTGAVIFRKIE